MEREGRKGISGTYYDMKVGKRNQTDLAGWQTEGEPSAFKIRAVGAMTSLLL